MPSPAWIYKGMYPWVPTEAVPYYEGGSYNPIVGPGTAFPAETGWAPTHDLYFQPKHLILSMQWQYTETEGGDGSSGSASETGLARCNRGRELLTLKDGRVDFEYPPPSPDGGGPDTRTHVVRGTFEMNPDSRFTLPSTGGTRPPRPGEVRPQPHYLKMKFSGSFTALSSMDHFTTDRQFPPIIPDDNLYRVGYLEVVANPGGQQSIYLIPIWRYGPNELIRSVNGQITRRRWLPAEL